MAISKNYLAIGIAILLIVSFAVGLYASPYVFPKAPEPTPKTTWQLISEKGKIVVGCSPDYPPYEFLNQTGGFTGFEVELTELVAKRLNLTVEWRSMGFDLIIPEIQAKTIDLGVAGFSVTPKRMQVVQFTMPHTVAGRQHIMLQSRATELGITKVNSIEELVNYNLTWGTQVGSIFETQLRELINAGKLSDDDVKTYDDFMLLHEDLKRGVVDIQGGEDAVISLLRLEAEQKGEEPLVVVYNQPGYPVGFVANLDSDALVDQINIALAQLTYEGKIAALKAKWKFE